MTDLEKMYPPNTDMGKKEDTAPKMPAVKTGVKKSKKSLGTKFAEAFVPEDVVDVKGYLLTDVLIPNLKDLFFDMIAGGLEMALWGGYSGRSRRSRLSSSGGSIVRYDRAGDRKARDNRPSARVGGRRSDYLDEYPIFESRADAEETITLMCEVIERYGQVTVAELNERTGITGQFTDNYWGWDDLEQFTSQVSVKRSRDGGYMLVLPQPVNLKK